MRSFRPPSKWRQTRLQILAVCLSSTRPVVARAFSSHLALPLRPDGIMCMYGDRSAKIYFFFAFPFSLLSWKSFGRNIFYQTNFWISRAGKSNWTLASAGRTPWSDTVARKDDGIWKIGTRIFRGDPLSNIDMALNFATREDAIAFCEKNRWQWEIEVEIFCFQILKKKLEVVGAKFKLINIWKRNP